MYIVIPQATYPTGNFVTSTLITTSPPIYFQTKELLLAYLKTATGSYRVFEATELKYKVSVELTGEVTDDINNPGWKIG